MFAATRSSADSLVAEADRSPLEQFGLELLCASVPELVSGEWQPLSCSVQRNRTHMGKRIVWCLLVYRDGPGGPIHAEPMVAVHDSRLRGASQHRALTTLWNAGFRPPAPFRVPRPYGYSAGQATLLMGAAEGVLWTEYLGEGRESQQMASAAAASWLEHLHLSSLAAAAVPPECQASSLVVLTDELALAHPRSASALRAVCERLTARLTRYDGPLAPSHGDFHPSNVFVADGCVTAIDVGELALREPAADVGYAVAQLLIRARYQYSSPASGVEAARAFWDRYRQSMDVPWQRVAVQVARAFLQGLHYELSILRNGRVELLTAWLPLIETVLDSDDASDLQGLIRVG